MAHHPQRRSYTQLYIVVFIGRDGAKTRALCEKKDGHLLAFTDYDVALKRATGLPGIVTNWTEFCRRGLLGDLAVKPDALRIYTTDLKKNRRVYHAELDATPEELRTLNRFSDYEKRQNPEQVAAAQKTAKVWEEEAK